VHDSTFIGPVAVSTRNVLVGPTKTTHYLASRRSPGSAHSLPSPLTQAGLRAVAVSTAAAAAAVNIDLSRQQQQQRGGAESAAFNRFYRYARLNENRRLNVL